MKNRMRQDRQPPPDRPDSTGTASGLALQILPERFAICRLAPDARTPHWVHESSFHTISRSPDELSIVCEEKLVPERIRCERGWRAIRVAGPLDPSLIGVLESLARPLAHAQVSLFTISTFDTDYLLVRAKNLDTATRALEAAGHRFEKPAKPPATAAASPAAAAEASPQPREEAAGPADGDAPAPEDRSGARSRVVKALSELFSSVRNVSAERRPVPPEAPKPEPSLPASEPQPAATARAAEAREPEAPEPAILDPAADHDQESRQDDAQPKQRPKRRRRRRSRKAEQTAETAADRERSEGPEQGPPQRGTPEQEAPRPKASRAGAEQPDDAEPDDAEPDDVERRQKAPERRHKATDRRRPPDDEGADASGLYSGAIPQHSVELTDDSFESLGLSAPILRTVREVGFTHPTPVQAGVIPRALEGRDVIGLAETGSGKTAAFCLPLAERLTHGQGIRGLILCPTREIALQTKAFLDVFGRDHELETVAVIGGVKMGPQIRGFERRADILVATPGRLADHLRRRNLRLDELEEVVLDEADHMLDLGFLPQIREILEQVPVKHRIMMFSATMPPPIENLTRLFMEDPVRIDERPVGHVASGIEHRLYLVKEEDMKDCLVALLNEVEGSTLIFTRRKLYSEWLARQLELAGFDAARIHSDRSQAQRVRALRGFREGKHRILVATDVAARGLDIPRIEHVVNYSLPETPEDYIHRAGRTARGQAAGIVSSIGTWQDKVTVRDLERRLGIELPRCTVAGIEPWVELKKRKTVRRRRML